MKLPAASWILALLKCLLPLAAFAAEQHKSFILDEKAMLGTQPLKPGQYTMTLDDSRDATKVN